MAPTVQDREVGGQVPYDDYIRADEAAYRQAMGNIARVAVAVANTGRTSDLTGVDAELFAEHGVTPPPDAHLGLFLPALREAIGAVADAGALAGGHAGV